jgi:TonB-linked SusC/RagA family outer membrane protein
MNIYYSLLKSQRLNLTIPAHCRVMLLLVSLLLFSSVSAQNIVLNLNNVPLKEVFKQLESETSYKFLFKTEDVNPVANVSINVSNGDITSVMSQCLSGTGLTWEVDDDVVIVRKATVSEAQPTAKVEPIIFKARVTDENGDPLPGVTITFKETWQGTTTDMDGNFSIEVMKGQTLLLTFVGMKRKEYTVTKTGFANIIMEEDVSLVSEYVVNGYFATDKKTYTGSAVTISKQELQSIGNTNVFQAISVLDPSFRIVENNDQGSNPNSLPKFEIRGASGIPSLRTQFEGDPNMPTFIVDGFEMSLQKVYDLDPTRIESITILKDAAASALYGSRSANGVVVVELSRPQKGKISLTYGLKYLLTTPDLTDYSLLNATEKLEAERLANVYNSTIFGSEFNDAYNQRLKNVLQGHNTYWLNKPLQVGQNATHSITLQGGDDAIQYQVNLNASPQKGVMIGSERNRYALGNTLTYRFKKINFTNTMNYDYVVSNNSPYGAFSTYAKLNPYYRYTDDEGHFLYQLDTYDNTFNPLWNSTLTQKDQSVYSLFTESFMMDWLITDGLRLKASGSVNVRDEIGEKFLPALHTSFGNSTNMMERGSYDITDGKSIDFQGRLSLSYIKSIRKHNVIVNYGSDIAQQDFKSHGFSVVGFPFEGLDDPSFGAGYRNGSKPTGRSLLSRSAGMFINANYAYNNIYFADFMYRTDISSRFGKDNRWAPFWSSGLGYNLHNEPFMKQFGFIDQLKFRGSFGYTGSQNYDPSQSFTQYRYITDQFYNGIGIGSYMMALGNDQLKWQRSKSLNGGVDFGFLKNRLVVSADLYKRNATDLLTPVTIAPSLGFSSYMANLGESENRGYELSLRGTPVKTKDFTLSLMFRGAKNQNKLIKISNALRAWNDEQDAALANPSSSNAAHSIPRVRFIEGQSMNTIWAVPSLGIDPANGKEIFVDNEGNTTYVWSTEYYRPYTADPDLEGTFGLTLRWKSLSFNSYLKFSTGRLSYNHTLVDRVENADIRKNVDSRVLYGRWKEPGDISFFKDIKDNSKTRPSSRFIQKDNYLTMPSINLSYDFKPELLKKVAGMKSLRLTFYMNDVFHVSTIQMERGLNYPYAQTFNFSLSSRF